VIRRLLPFSIAFVVPAALFAGVYLTQSENPVWGTVWGGIGLLGALLAELVRVLQARRVSTTDLERYRADPQATVLRWRHEGLERLHEDIERDERSRPRPEGETEK
jgi:hypothetical protein